VLVRRSEKHKIELLVSNALVFIKWTNVIFTKIRSMGLTRINGSDRSSLAEAWLVTHLSIHQSITS
jgi:hypothetical protein